MLSYFESLCRVPVVTLHPLTGGREEIHPSIDPSRFRKYKIKQGRIKKNDSGGDMEECELELFPHLLEQR